MPTSAHEVARASADAMWRHDEAARRLGVEVVEVAQGRATVRMAVTADMVNGHGMCHGGYVFAVADTAFAYACNTYDERTVAAGADITYVAPAKEGDVLTARAVEAARFGRSGIYDVTVTDQRGEVIALFRGRSRTIGGSLVRDR